MREAVAVVDLQFGSTGKGQIAGTIGRKWEVDTAVCANGPNAGHTYRWWQGRMPASLHSIVHTVMPVCAVLPTVRNILLGPGAVIDLDKLQNEIILNGDLLAGKRLIIHPNAAIVRAWHRENEALLVGIGSTMKGTAEAVIEKMRRSKNASIARNWSPEGLQHAAAAINLKVIVDYDEYDSAVDSSVRMLVEGAQGASLSMHSPFYPHTTSRDVSISQVWADCRLPVGGGRCAVVGVCRAYPIRVANRFNDAGEQVGYSGDCYDDQREMKWEEIGREPELTTVTRLPRRLFTFSTKQIIDSARYNAPTSVALTFCDYLPSHNADHPEMPVGQQYPIGPGERISPCVRSLCHRIEAAAGCAVDFVSFGPDDSDVYRLRKPRERLSTEFILPWEHQNDYWAR